MFSHVTRLSSSCDCFHCMLVTETHPDAFPNKLTPMDSTLDLVDSGFAINTACPPVLRPHRHADVILSLGYSWDEDHLQVKKYEQRNLRVRFYLFDFFFFYIFCLFICLNSDHSSHVYVPFHHINCYEPWRQSFCLPLEGFFIFGICL